MNYFRVFIDKFSLENKYFLLSSLFSLHLGFIGATYIIFFYSYGIDKLTTNILSSLFSLSVFLFEIPSGVITDKHGNRKVLLFSGITLSISMILFSFIHNELSFIFAQIIWGLSFALYSGALDAWYVNKLDTKSNLSTLFAKSNKIGNFSMILAGFIGGVLGNISLDLPWVFSLVSSIIYTILICIIITDDNLHLKKEQSQKVNLIVSDLLTETKKSFTIVNSEKIIKNIMIINGLLAFSLSPIFVYWSPYLQSLGNNMIWILGGIWVAIKVSNYIGNLFLEKNNFLKKNIVLSMMLVLICISMSIFLGTFINTFMSVLISFLIFEILLGIIQPLQKDLINSNIPDSKRASILSIDSMISKIFNFISLVISGYIADKVSIEVTWFLSSACLILVIFFLKKIRSNLSTLIDLNNI